MKTKNYNGIMILAIVLMAVAIFLSGCANNEPITACLKGHTYGFWAGLWHGIIAPVNLIAMIWRHDVSVFAPNNNGAWYAFGFILGSGGWGFLGGHRTARSFRKNR
jgi:hypothetical protein